MIFSLYEITSNIDKINMNNGAINIQIKINDQIPA